MTDEEAVREVRALFAAYPHIQLSRETLAVWAADLKPYELEETRAAFAIVRSRVAHTPTIADVKRAMIEARHPDWGSAWRMVLDWDRALRDWERARAKAENELTSDRYERWFADDCPPLVPKPQEPPAEVMQALTNLGGLSEFRRAIDGDGVGVLRAHFRDVYLGVLTHADQRQLDRWPNDGPTAITAGEE